MGAGTGTTVGKLLGIAKAMKGGFGCAVAASPDDSVAVAAMVVVNALGDVRDARGDVIAGARNGRRRIRRRRVGDATWGGGVQRRRARDAEHDARRRRVERAAQRRWS